jgi:omega-6 fatty acid desaturase (delta-12 desaturase)
MGIYNTTMRVNTRPPKAEPVREALPFTLADIRGAIPPELFKASLTTSWYYIARDLALFVLIAGITNVLLEFAGDVWALRALIWVAYTVVQGAVGFGMWVIGHECGHQAYFGDGHQLNDPVGFVIHSAFCDPYHSWRITHATHHRYTNNKELDTVYPPKDYPAALFDAGEAFPPLHFFMVAMYVLLGWPMYIASNLEGHRYESFHNHFDPNAPMFTKKDRSNVILSGFGVVAMLLVLASCAKTFGVANVLCWYGLGWLGTHAWLVVVTFLQHADERAPHYDVDDNFDFVKGAIATVDRNYGALWNNLTHHITDAHVVHHIFSRVPFYRAKVMTPYVAKFLGKHYLFDDRPMWTQFWASWWSHQSSFFESRQWKAAHPGLDRLNARNLNKM